MTDVRVVRLIRKEMGEWNKEKRDTEKLKLSFLATDYFDVMQVDKIEIENPEYQENPLAAVMGIWPAEKPDEDEIVAHSYSLYFNGEMLEQEKGRAWCGDPFVEEAMPVLSMIQVYITPDIMAHALPGASAAELINAIYDDLHEAIRQFREQHPDAVFKLRIFKTLSTGDFAIAVRSAKVETSFQISSAVRQRTIGRKSDQNDLKLVMHKTYTLLTFDNCALSVEEGLGEGRFVLRGCYSNLYWRKKREIEQGLEDKNLWPDTELFGLNGRYDFSVRIREEEFKQLYPLIRKYKEGEPIPAVSLAEKQNISIVDYIGYLMSEGYLSYINERCLISQKQWTLQALEEKDCLKMDFSSDFTGENLLENKINEFYTEVKEKYLHARKRLARIPARRKNLMQYTELLGKLVQLCYSINVSSDARVYAAALLEQLDVVIDSIHVYIKMYRSEEVDESERENIFDLLEVYIRESVQALDSYAKYIRNLNLQSIQTPNYNLESNMGMEKLLIGYSEMLDIFVKFYQRKYPFANSGGKARALLPIVVPALHKGDMSVEVLFMEGVTRDWESERIFWEETDRSEIRHCMVVSVPTLMELGDIRTMVVTLFHENAHQFHDYEPVSRRNDAILRYAVHTVMGEVAEELAMKMQRELGGYERESRFAQFLQTNLTAAYIRYYYKENDKKGLIYSFQNAPLNNFQELLICDFRNYFEKRIQAADFSEHFGEFLRELRCCLVWEEKSYSDAIILMNEIIQAGISGIQHADGESTPLPTVEQIMRCAYVLALECAYQNREDAAGQSLVKTDYRKWVKVAPAENFDFRRDWEERFNVGADGREGKERCHIIWRIFNDFANWVKQVDEERLWSLDNRNNTGGNSETGKSFYEEAYDYLCEEWKQHEDRKETERNSPRVREAMGRMLGIDYHTADNAKIFKEELSSVFHQKLNGLMDGVKWRIGKYREETADMMMCNVLDLSPFGYLSLLAAIWPIDENPLDAFITRFVNVFLFQWCLDEQVICPEKVRKNCIDLVLCLEKSVAALKKQFLAGQYKSKPYVGSNMEYEELIGILTDLEICCEEMCGESEERYNLERAKVYRNMARLAKTLIDYNQDMIDYMDVYTELKEDYVRGVEHYRGLNDEMCKDENPKVREVGRFCRMIGKWQNDPDGFLADAKEMNRSSIEFLLDMYYTNKRRIAQEVQQKNVI